MDKMTRDLIDSVAFAISGTLPTTPKARETARLVIEIVRDSIASAPPSAPVGVEDVVMAARNAENAIRNCAAAGQIGEGYVQYADDLRDAVQRLTQQPAAGMGEEIMVNAAHDVYTLPLQPSGLSSGPRFVVHVPGPEQPAAVDGMAELVGLLDEVRSHFTRDDDLPDDLLPRIDAALATQQQGGSDDA